MAERKSFLVRIDPEVWNALQRWAADELRSVNGQVEFLLRRALTDAGRLPRPPGAGKSGKPRGSDRAGGM